MKLNQITALLAAGTALLSGAAHALQPTESADIEIFMSGATAQDGNIAQLFEELCVGGTLDTFKDNANASKPGANHTAYFCQMDGSKFTNPALSASNPKVLFHKRSSGGSAQGVNPVVDEQAIEAMAINNGNCTTPAGSDGFWRCRVSQAGDTVQQVSDVGVSDVNPEMFTGENTPDGSKAADAAKIQQRMTVQSGGALVFGVPVTKALRDALQAAQIETGELGAGCQGVETEACMPSLSKQLIASLFAGQIGKWSDVKVVANGGATSKSLFDFAASGTDEKVHICRRVNGSGTQAQANAKFLNAPCTAGALSPIKTSNTTAGPVVVLNSGSGDVDICLADYNDGTNNGGNNSTGKAWAIGLQSTEKNASNTLNYRFVKVDGYAPTLENAYSGHYFDFAENTYQWRKAAFNGPAGDKLTIIKKIATDAGAPSIIAANNAKFKQVFGEAGYLAVSASGFTPSANGVFDSNNPVTPYTHAPNGLSLNNCRAPVVDKTDTGAQPSRL